MTVESIPKFTVPAAKLWAAISSESKKLLLANVWCGKCRHAVVNADLKLIHFCNERRFNSDTPPLHPHTD